MPRRILRADQYQHPSALVRRIAARHEAQIAEAVDQAFEDFQDQQEADDHDLAIAIGSGGAAGLVAALGFDRLRDDLGTSLRGLDGLFREAAASAAAESGLRVAPGGTPDVIALPAAADAAPFYSDLDRYRSQLIDDIVESSEDGIAAAVQRAAALNIPIDDIAASVRDAIGLTDQQAFAVFNYRRALQEGAASLEQADAWRLRDHRFDATAARAARGEPVDQDTIDRMVNAYARRQLNYRAQMIASTEAHKVASAGVRANYIQAVNNGVLDIARIKRHWRVAIDEKTCPICYSVPLLNPNGVGMMQPFMSIEGPLQDIGVHPWCLPGDQRVHAHGIRAAAKRHFDGEIIIIRTASGKQLTCSPNHPILTPTGWVGAGFLDEGGHVISSRARNWKPRNCVDDEHMPSAIEKVADAFRKPRNVSAVPVPVSAEDFHGDGKGSKIAVIWADRLLWAAGNAARGEHLAEQLFRLANIDAAVLHRFGNLDAPGQRRMRAFGRSVGCRDLVHSLADRHVPPFEHFGGALVAERYASFAQNAPERAAADARLARQLIDGLAGEVGADKVIEIIRHPFSDHVFNLETAGGWYLAEGIVTHNCRCSIEYTLAPTAARTSHSELVTA